MPQLDADVDVSPRPPERPKNTPIGSCKAVKKLSRNLIRLMGIALDKHQHDDLHCFASSSRHASHMMKDTTPLQFNMILSLCHTPLFPVRPNGATAPCVLQREVGVQKTVCCVACIRCACCDCALLIQCCVSERCCAALLGAA